MNSGSTYDYSVSSEELLRRCKENDETALRELFRRYERPVYGMLYRMLGRHEDAEEALSDVFVKLWKAAAGFRGDAKFTTWLYRIAGNTARDFLRSRKARPEFPVDDEILSEMDLSDGSSVVDPEASLVGKEEVARIERAMLRLSPEDRQLVTLFHVRELGLDEIASIMGQKRNNLKVKLFRARQRLRVHLSDMDMENDNEVQQGKT